MIVLKFGGTSVSSKQSIKQIKFILNQKNENYIVVVSALSGITNKLEQIADEALKGDITVLLEIFRTVHFDLIKEIMPIEHQTALLLEVQHKCNILESICKSIWILKECSPRTRAHILSFGEQLSSMILHQYLYTEGTSIHLLNSRKMIVANKDYLNAEVDFEQSTKQILANVKAKNYIAGGFIASNSEGETTTLGRGGSDYSASIYAYILNASSLEIWSDINGIHSGNPSKINNTKALDNLSYEEAFEMAYFGAKVLYPPSILPIKKKGIPLYLKNTFQPEQYGTYISNDNKKNDQNILGISSLDNIAIITISGVGLAKNKGFARQVFQTLEEQNINIILITQSCSEQSIGIGIKQINLNKAVNSLEVIFQKQINDGTINHIKSTVDQCIIAVIGDNMKHKIGLAGKLFSAIGDNGINVTAIAQGASERNISIVIKQIDEEKALNVIHEKFFAPEAKSIHLFIAGIGNVGKEFIQIINAQKEHLYKTHQINLKIIGIANSKKMYISENGSLTPTNINELNINGSSYSSFPEFTKIIILKNLPNSIFIDNTAAKTVSESYASLFENKISVVTCNKIACSSESLLYNNLINLTKTNNCSFKYETTVGAALPIIKTIQDLIISGDQIHKIEAVLSGSLNFIFNNYKAETSFANIVKEAKVQAYTEPNPLIDLSGLDVMRKILILARTSGIKGELSDIKFKSFLPDECSNVEDVNSLFQNLEKNEAYFKSLYNQAKENGNKLKIIATLDKGNMTVQLKEITPDSPFYNVNGKDNIISIYTNRYKEQALIIKGAGAGAAVTASGVFADLMQIINK